MQLKIQHTANGIAVSGVTDFDLTHTFECGQCFRWVRQPDGAYEGVACGRHVRLRYGEDGVLFIDGADEADFNGFWFDYFDFGRDYGALKKEFAAIDRHMKAAIEFGDGMRLLRQDMWETLVSFIMSANNHIPRIARSLDLLSCGFGAKVRSPLGGECNIFPSPEDMKDASADDLSSCKAGFRCKYINQAVGMALRGEINLQRIRRLPEADDARAELMRIPGVGPKVADCVLLFSGARYDVFPIDVWVKRVMEALYFGRDAKNEEIQQFAKEHFGELRGIAQQYLFYYARMNKIGTTAGKERFA